tara:strand:+ start:130 stop:282 length:153 start_codon:yes stop_codon:yes gene_type:complete
LILFLLAYSPTFLAKIAPKTSPNPQLKKETKMVENVMIVVGLNEILDYNE